MERFGAEQVKTLAATGCKPTYVRQKAGQVLFCPAGWLLAERASAGVLLYGIRRSLLPKCSDSAVGYEELIGLHKKDDKATAKMEDALKLMQGDHA